MRLWLIEDNFSSGVDVDVEVPIELALLQGLLILESILKHFPIILDVGRESLAQDFQLIECASDKLQLLKVRYADGHVFFWRNVANKEGEDLSLGWVTRICGLLSLLNRYFVLLQSLFLLFDHSFHPRFLEICDEAVHAYLGADRISVLNFNKLRGQVAVDLRDIDICDPVCDFDVISEWDYGKFVSEALVYEAGYVYLAEETAFFEAEDAWSVDVGLLHGYKKIMCSNDTMSGLKARICYILTDMNNHRYFALGESICLRLSICLIGGKIVRVCL